MLSFLSMRDYWLRTTNVSTGPGTCNGIGTCAFPAHSHRIREYALAILFTCTGFQR